MAIRVISVLKSWFETGKKPTQAQYSDVFDSLMHRTDGAKLALDRVEGLTAALEEAGTGGGGDGSNLYNADGVIPEATERLVEIEESANIAFTGTKSVTNIGDAGFESISRDISGNESAIENRGGAVVHRSDLSEPIKSEAYYAPTSDNHYAQRKFVLDKIAEIVNSSPAALDTLNELAAALGNDVNFATTVTNALGKKEQITPTCFASFSGGVTATATTGLSLSVQPRIVDVNFANVNSGSGTYTLNVDGTGALAVYDSRTDALHTKNSIPNGKYITLIRRNNRYYTTGIEGTNDQLNALETFALSGNNYVVERDYSSLPSWIRGRVSAVNPTATPQLLLKLAGEVAVGYNVVDVNGRAINARDLKVGTFYTFEYDVTANNFRVLQIDKVSYVTTSNITATSVTYTSSIAKNYELYNHTTNGTRTLGLGALRLNEIAYWDCRQNKLTFSAASGVTLNPREGGFLTCPASGGKVAIVCESETVDATGAQTACVLNIV